MSVTGASNAGSWSQPCQPRYGGSGYVDEKARANIKTPRELIQEGVIFTLESEIEFAHDDALEMGDDIARTQAARRGREHFNRPRGEIERVDIAPERLFNLR